MHKRRNANSANDMSITMHLNSKMVAMLKGLRPGVLNLDVISFVFVLMLNLITSRMALFEIDALINAKQLLESPVL